MPHCTEWEQSCSVAAFPNVLCRGCNVFGGVYRDVDIYQCLCGNIGYALNARKELPRHVKMSVIPPQTNLSTEEEAFMATKYDNNAEDAYDAYFRSSKTTTVKDIWVS